MPQPVDRIAPQSAELKALAALLQPAINSSHNYGTRARNRAILTTSVLAMLLPLGFIFTFGWPTILRGFLLIGWGLLFLFVPGRTAFPLLQIAQRDDAHPDEALSRVLREAADPAAIGILIEAEAASTGELRSAIQAALTRLLPRAAEIDFRHRFAEQVERLYTHLDAASKLVNYTSDRPTFAPYPLGGTWERTTVVPESFPELTDQYEAFLIAILDCLKSAGDAGALPYVEALAAAKTPTEQMERIQRAASISLEAMHDRLTSERRAETLVRPTMKPTDPLLRPGRNPAGAGVESLLRPDPADNAADSSPNPPS